MSRGMSRGAGTTVQKIIIRPPRRQWRAVLASSLMSSVVGAAVLLPASPALAAADPTAIINASGGLTTSDGLRVYYGNSQVQILRNGEGQLWYGYNSGGATIHLPSPGTTNALTNGIVMRVGNTVVGTPSLANNHTAPMTAHVNWDNITTTGGSASGAGTITSTLSWTDPGTSRLYTLDLTLSYDGTSDYYHEQAVVTVPTGNTVPVKLYRALDTQLGGNDAGPGFYNPTGPIVGGFANDSSTVEALRYTAGPAWTGYWSGNYYEPTGYYGRRGLDLPNTIAASIDPDPVTDNGIAVNWDIAAAHGGASGDPAPVGTTTMDYDLIFSANTTVASTPQAITFPAPANTTTATSSLTLGATSDANLPVVYTSATTSVCTVAGSSLSILSAGTCTVHADQSGDLAHPAATTVTRSFAITGTTPQTITFPTPPNTSLSAGTVTLGATSNSALAVTYTTSTPAVCTVSGSNVTLVSTGVCALTADQGGDATYAAAATVAQSFTVTPAVVAAPVSTPSAPLNLTVLGAGSAATVSFDPPARTGTSPITGYQVTVSGGDLTTPITLSGPGRSVLVPGLNPNTSYTVSAVAINAAGPGTAASTTATWTPSNVTVAPGVTRLAGTDRTETATNVSRALFPVDGRATAAVIATSKTYADSIGGSRLASTVQGPLLLTDTAALQAGVAAEVRRLVTPGGRVYILGDTNALSQAVRDSLAELNSTYTITRLGGADRFETATRIADVVSTYTGHPAGSPQAPIYLASGTNYPDGLAVAALAGKTGGVVLLTDGATLPASTAAYLRAHDPTGAQTTTVGGAAAAAYPTAGTSLVGADRYETSALIAGKFPAATTTTVGLASGANWPDALVGGAAMGIVGGPLLLTEPATLTPATKIVIDANANLTASWVFGGPTSLSTTTEDQVKALLPPTP